MRTPLGWAAVAAVAVCMAAGAAQAVSLEAERELGRRFDLAARGQLPLIADPEVVGYVDAVGQQIVRGLDDSFFAYQFAVVRDGSINAFAVPGGYIYVHSGLLTRVANDDELAGVLGHEIAHVHAHHLARQQEATQLMNYATLLGMLLSVVQPGIGAAAAAANAAVQLQYRREFEQEADYMGARYVAGAGYEPHGMLDFFKKMGDEQRITPTFVPPYLLSHPLTEDRMNHLEAVLRTPQWAAQPRRPTSTRLRYVQALARVRSEPPADVMNAYQRQLEAAPRNPTARYLFGVVCLETGQLDAAQKALDGARTAGVMEADRELGRLALRLRDPARARTLLESAVARDPRDVGALVELARAAEALNDAGTARQAYRRAVEAAPNLDTAHYGLGVLAGRAGDEAAGFFHLASAARLQGRYEQALQQYARAQPLLPATDPRTDEARRWVEELSAFLRVNAPTPGRRTPASVRSQ
jgi:predicted Zn-dependent protease